MPAWGIIISIHVAGFPSLWTRPYTTVLLLRINIFHKEMTMIHSELLISSLQLVYHVVELFLIRMTDRTSGSPSPDSLLILWSSNNNATDEDEVRLQRSTHISAHPPTARLHLASLLDAGLRPLQLGSPWEPSSSTPFNNLDYVYPSKVILKPSRSLLAQARCPVTLPAPQRMRKQE